VGDAPGARDKVCALKPCCAPNDIMTDDPVGVPMNCPYCGAPLTYVRTEGAGSVGETFVFRCARHGVLILPPDGRIRQQPA
jgi:hypothetical protein